MGDQADGGELWVAGDGAVNIAVFVHPGILNAHAVHFLHQRGGQRFLLFRGGAGVGCFVRLGVKGHITQKAFYNRFHRVLLPIKVKMTSMFRLFQNAEAHTFKAFPGRNIVFIDFPHFQPVEAQRPSPAYQRGNHSAADTSAPVARVADDNGHVLLPEAHIPDGAEHAAVQSFDKVQLPMPVQIVVHIGQGLPGVWPSDAVHQPDRFGILIPLEGKVKGIVKFSQTQSVVHGQDFRLFDVGNRHCTPLFCGEKSRRLQWRRLLSSENLTWQR